jgi:hypothetical protein
VARTDDTEAGSQETGAFMIESTGLVLLHEGNLIVPDARSLAALSFVDGDGALVLEFPVEVEVRVVEACDPDQHADTTLTRLMRALDGLA